MQVLLCLVILTVRQNGVGRLIDGRQSTIRVNIVIRGWGVLDTPTSHVTHVLYSIIRQNIWVDSLMVVSLKSKYYKQGARQKIDTPTFQVAETNIFMSTG